MNTHFVISVNHAIYGVGASEREAYEDALEWLDAGAEIPSFDSMSRYVGTARTCDGGPVASGGRKSMTQNGEMHSGELVLMTRADAEALGYDVGAHD